MPLPEFVGIVGVSRSGTSLMRKILDDSSQLAIADENNFLGHLIAAEGIRTKMRRVGDLGQEENVYRLVDFLYSGEFRQRSISKNWGHWRWLKRNVDREDFAQRILSTDRSDRSVFVAALRAYAEAHEKSIIGEKTPAHFRYVDTLFEWFPEGKVVHMIRDPRAIFASEVRRRSKAPASKLPVPYRLLQKAPFLLKLFLLVVVTLSWRQSIEKAKQFKQRYPNQYYLMRFEDLVSDPAFYIQDLCAFLGINLESEMLEQHVISRGFAIGKEGFDQKAADRWRDHIDPWIAQWFERVFKRDLQHFKYD